MVKKFLLFIFLCGLFFNAWCAPPSLYTEQGGLQPALIHIADIYDIPSENRFETLLDYAQKYFRQKTKERWQFLDRSSESLPELMQAFNDLNCIHEVRADHKKYTYALVLGSSQEDMKARISFLIKEWERGVRFSKVVLLSGERPLDPKREPMARSFNTESSLMQYLWDTMTEGELYSLPLTHIRSCMKEIPEGLKRPTTLDTIVDFLKTSPVEGSCLAFSSQPFVGYQHSVLKTYLPSAFALETVGPESKQELSLAIYLDNLAKWMFQENVRLSQE